MSQLEQLPYAQGDGYQAVELPYDGDELGMVVLLPAAGQFGQFEKGLTSTRVQSILGALTSKSVQLQIPKFRFESEFMLVETLKAMGVADAFDPGRADLSGISDKEDLYISDVIHKAIVDVMEKGTEAAAATAVGIRATGKPMAETIVTVDRPFVFLIRDVKTGSIVFVGRVENPLG
jgi:serpin B